MGYKKRNIQHMHQYFGHAGLKPSRQITALVSAQYYQAVFAAGTKIVEYLFLRTSLCDIKGCMRKNSLMKVRLNLLLGGLTLQKKDTRRRIIRVNLVCFLQHTY